MAAHKAPRGGVTRRGLLALAGAAGLLARWRSAAGQPVPRPIRIVARRFQFEPDTIEVRQGEPVVLEFEAPDVIMGFNLHAFDVRADLLPGQVTRVSLVAAKAGEFPFYCDVFCGSGHEDMDGVLRVSA